MGKLALTVLLVAVTMIGLAQVAFAADLQAGWHASPGAPQIYAADENGDPYLRSGGAFLTPPGTYGSFTVSGGPYGSTSWRKATVTSDVYGVGPGESLILPLSFVMSVGDPVLYVAIDWGTDYDASQMRLELWRNRSGGSTERVWNQELSGPQSGASNIMYDFEYEGAFFYKIAVVPEPSTLVAIGCSVLAVALGGQRRRLS